MAAIGDALARALDGLLAEAPGSPRGPQALATALGVDKVLASRVLKAARATDPIAVTHLVPGPEPLRRFIGAAADHGARPDTIEAADQAVSRFEALIRDEAGDRGSLDAIISAWLPEAREGFAVRRKQAAYRAMSQLKGASADVDLATVFVHPADDPDRLDVVWLFGMLGLQRLRPGARIKFATRRMTDGAEPRKPTTLDGEPVESLEGLRLDAFCSRPTARLDVHRAGEAVHYTLAGDEYGPRSAVDLVFAERNRGELPRYVPAGRKRKAWFFAEVATPLRTLSFTALVHDDVYPGEDPQLHIYDTVPEGVANVNDPSRDIDRTEHTESVQRLEGGAAAMRDSGVHRYGDMVAHVLDRTGWSPGAFRAYRCRVEFPIYGSQVVMAFDPPPPPAR